MKKRDQREFHAIKKGNLSIKKSMIICSLLIIVILTSEINFVSVTEAKITEEAIIDTALGETSFRMIIDNQKAYLLITSGTEDPYIYNQYIDIYSLEQKQNPVKLGRYHFDQVDQVFRIKVRDQFLYALSMVNASVQTLAISIINITNPSHLWEVGRYQEANVSSPWDFTVYKDYCYINSLNETKIIKLTNKTNPMLVKNYPQPAYFIEIENDLMYTINSTLKVFNLTDPENPTFLGELQKGCGGKMSLMSVDIHDDYFYAGFLYGGLCSYSIKDPTNPVVWGDYSFPKYEESCSGQIQDIVAVGNRLFACGHGLYVFGIGIPLWIRRITHKNIQASATEIAEENSYLFINTWDNIRIFSYKDYTIIIVLGITIEIIPVVIFLSIRYRKQKKKKIENAESEQQRNNSNNRS